MDQINSRRIAVSNYESAYCSIFFTRWKWNHRHGIRLIRKLNDFFAEAISGMKDVQKFGALSRNVLSRYDIIASRTIIHPLFGCFPANSPKQGGHGEHYPREEGYWLLLRPITRCTAVSSLKLNYSSPSERRCYRRSGWIAWRFSSRARRCRLDFKLSEG